MIKDINELGKPQYIQVLDRTYKITFKPDSEATGLFFYEYELVSDPTGEILKDLGEAIRQMFLNGPFRLPGPGPDHKPGDPAF